MEKEIKVFLRGEKQYTSQKTGRSGTIYTVTEDGDGTEYTTFSKTLYDAIPDSGTIKIRFELKQQGNFTNRIIEAVEKDGEWIESGKSAAGGGYGGRGTKDTESIQRQVALKAAVDLCVADKIKETDDIIAQADTFAKWLQEREKTE